MSDPDDGSGGTTDEQASHDRERRVRRDGGEDHGHADHEHSHDHAEHGNGRRDGRTGATGAAATGTQPGDATAATYTVPEMDCPSCAEKVTTSIRELDGIERVDTRPTTGQVQVAYDEDRTDRESIADRVEAAGYAVEDRASGTTVRLTVPEMDCASCGEKVTAALDGVTGVERVDARATSGTVRVTYDPDATGVDELVASVESAGYPVTGTRGDTEATGTTSATSDDLWRSGRAIRTWIGALLLAGGLGLSVLGPAANVRLGAVFGSELLLADTAFLAAAAVAGAPILRNGYYSARTLQLDIDFLMSVAVVGAVLVTLAFGGGALGEKLYFEAATLAVLFSVAELLERYSMDRARRSLESLLDLSPDEARVRRDGEERLVPAREVAVGDRVIVKPGERVPADGRVVDGTSAVDQSPVTGESVPVDKAVGDEVYAGSVAEGGYLEIEATAAGDETTLARVAELVENAQANRTDRERFVERFADRYTPVVVALSVATTALAPTVLGVSLATAVVYGLTLLVLACPCAFVIATPVSVVSGITSAARVGVLVKGGDHLEAMGSVATVAFDKTGTLTKGALTVTDVIPLGGNDASDVLRCARGLETRSEHPIGEAIVAEAESVGESGSDRVHGTGGASDTPRVTDFESLTGKGVRAEVDDTPHYAGKPGLFAELGFDLSHVHATTDGGVVTTTSRQLCERNNCLDLLADTVPELQAEGKTVVLVGTDEELEGVIAVADEVRPEARRTVEQLHEAGVRTAMVTGDNERTARAVASEVGIEEVHAELLPEEKVRTVERLADEGSVAMVGDGVNDAPALATATVGVAMGAAGTDAALETADVALLGDDLSRLPYLHELAVSTVGVIRQNVVASLAVKAGLATLVPFGYVPIWLAVLAGDAGMTLGVTGNAMRLARIRPDDD